MDAHRFDAFIKTWTAGASRRRLLQVLPAVVAGSVLPGAARAFDAGGAVVCPPAAAGACTGAADCPAGLVCINGACAALPSAAGGDELTPTPTVPTPDNGIGAQIGPEQVLPTRIYAGLCGQLGGEAAFQLIDIGAVGAEGAAPVGATSAVPARFSTTVVEAQLADLLAADHAIDVRTEAGDPNTAIVCGDLGGLLGGQVPGTELAIGLRERGGSGYTGIAWLRDEGERTLVNVFIAPGLAGGAAGEIVGADTAPPVSAAVGAETVDAAAETGADEATDTTAEAPALSAGTLVLTSADVNLRAAPTTDAAVVAVLGSGVELEVTGAAADGWVPVRDPATGRRGYVTADFVVLPA